MFNVVLVEPEIPPNTGNVGRLCLATGADLHLVKPLGFSIDDRALKRAGLDYWQDVRVTVWESFAELREPRRKWEHDSFISRRKRSRHTGMRGSFERGGIFWCLGGRRRGCRRRCWRRIRSGV